MRIFETIFFHFFFCQKREYIHYVLEFTLYFFVLFGLNHFAKIDIVCGGLAVSNQSQRVPPMNVTIERAPRYFAAYQIHFQL